MDGGGRQQESGRGHEDCSALHCFFLETGELNHAIELLLFLDVDALGSKR